MKRVTTLIIMCCSLVLDVFSQEVNSPLDTLYEGGKEAYDQLATNTLVFPRRLMGEDIYGTLVYEITVRPDGQVQGKMMTKGHENFELVVLNLIEKSNAGWIKKDVLYKVYQPVFFGYPSDESESVSQEINSFPGSFVFPVLEPIVRALVVTRVTGSSPRVPSSDRGLTLGDIGLDKINDTPKVPSKKERSAILNQEVKRYLKNESKYLKQLDKGNSAKAFEYLCDMIRFNPFDSELIKKRMELAQELNISDYMSYDTPWLLALRRMGR